MGQGMTAAPDLCIAAFYCFVPMADPAAVRARLHDLCTAEGIKGTIILAAEGFNGTMAGSDAAIARLVQALLEIAGEARTEIKYARAPEMPFGRLKLRIKREIVTMGRPGLDFRQGQGAYVDPRDWNALIDDPGTILVDTRNSYEHGIGSFVGALDPATRSFSEFPGWLEDLAGEMTPEERAEKPLAMFCTGGIRCEKSTALARSLGFRQVYHLKGGILAYLEQVPEAESRWQGDCFVFDERVAVGHALAPGGHVLCKACGMPVPNGETEAHGRGCGAG
jgi:UPF0176 protein